MYQKQDNNKAHFDQEFIHDSWLDLKNKLDTDMPTQNNGRFDMTSIFVSSLFLLGLVSLLFSFSKEETPFASIPKLIATITSEPQPITEVSHQPNTHSTTISEKSNVTNNTQKDTSTRRMNADAATVRPTKATTEKEEQLANLYSEFSTLNRLHDYQLTSKKQQPVTPFNTPGSYSEQEQIVENTTPKSSNGATTAKAKRTTRIGIDVNSSIEGLVHNAGIGGGLSVFVPIGKRFALEPGLGYQLMKKGGLASSPEEELNVPSAARPILPAIGEKPTTLEPTVKYRLNQSIEVPLSFHYQPIKSIALTGGVDFGMVLNQRLVYSFENESAQSSFGQDAGDLSEYDRFSLTARGGISWFPTEYWKLGVSYGQNLNQQSSEESTENLVKHIFRLKMAKYF